MVRRRQPESDDYDYAAARAAGVRPDERGHWPDTYKRPNHITFSNESVHHGRGGESGGQWSQEGERWSFTPGPSNIQRHGMDNLRRYFREREPDATLVEPPDTGRGPGYAKGGFVKRDTRNYGKKDRR